MLIDFKEFKHTTSGFKVKVKKSDILQRTIANYRKITIIENCTDEELVKDLRRLLNCGGTIKDGSLQFQGFQKIIILNYLEKVDRLDLSL